jgi:hypothetical protein
MSDIDWGDAPTWIAAFFAAGAAVFAGGTLRSQRQQIAEQQAFIAEQSQNLQMERDELRAAAEDRRYAQARQIDTELRGLGVRVYNNSDAPIADVLVTLGEAPAHHAAEVFDALDRHSRTSGEYIVPMPVMGARRCFSFRGAGDVDPGPNFDVYFTDDAGVRWHLDQLGKLVEVPPPDVS